MLNYEKILTGFRKNRHKNDLHSGEFRGKDYVFVNCNLEGEFDINFETANNSGYTCGLSLEGATEFLSKLDLTTLET